LKKLSGILNARPKRVAKVNPIGLHGSRENLGSQKALPRNRLAGPIAANRTPAAKNLISKKTPLRFRENPRAAPELIVSERPLLTYPHAWLRVP
jgi:hypothetical protein